MKTLIKKILKEESLKQSLSDMIKDIGWDETASFFGDSEELVRLFNYDPMEFLNIYNDLDVVQSEQYDYYTLFRYEKGNNLMIYDRKNNKVFINYNNIWSVLRNDFGLNINETQELTQRWLSEDYNLRGVTTDIGNRVNSLC